MAGLDPAGAAYFTALAQLEQKYPTTFKFITSQPELLQIYLHAVSPSNPWTDAQVQQALQNSAYYKSTTDAQRQWDQLLIQDPQEAQFRYQTASAHNTQIWQQGGYSIPYTQFLQINNQAVRGGWSDDTLKAALAAAQRGLPMPHPGVQDSGVSGGDLQTNMDKIRQVAASYAVPLSDLSIYQKALGLMDGSSTIDGVTDDLKAQAISLYPGLTKALNAGETVDQYADPYKQLAQKYLNVNPGDIDWTDPKWNAFLNQTDPKTGARTSMSLDAAATLMRTDPRYGYDNTQGAVQQAAQFATQIAQKFGAV